MTLRLIPVLATCPVAEGGLGTGADPWRVALSGLGSEDIRVLVAEGLAAPAEVWALPGGCRIEAPGFVVDPQCCASLDDLAQWERAAAVPAGTEEQLWIGHPWLHAQGLDAATVRLRQTAEDAWVPPLLSVDVPRAALAEEARKARRTIEEFAARVAAVLAG